MSRWKLPGQMIYFSSIFHGQFTFFVQSNGDRIVFLIFFLQKTSYPPSKS